MKEYIETQFFTSSVDAEFKIAPAIVKEVLNTYPLRAP